MQVEVRQGTESITCVQACVVVQLLNTNAVQIIASASSQYELTPHYNKRWAGRVVYVFELLDGTSAFSKNAARYATPADVACLVPQDQTLGIKHTLAETAAWSN